MSARILEPKDLYDLPADQDAVLVFNDLVVVGKLTMGIQPSVKGEIE